MSNMKDTPNAVLVLYAVRNSEGKFFRAKGYNGGGETWVADINKAKIYGKIGGARGTITYFANDTKYPVPDLLKLTVGSIEVIDETKRVQKAKEKKAIAEAAYNKRIADQRFENAQRNLRDAQAEVERIKRQQNKS